MTARTVFVYAFRPAMVIPRIAHLELLVTLHQRPQLRVRHSHLLSQALLRLRHRLIFARPPLRCAPWPKCQFVGHTVARTVLHFSVRRVLSCASLRPHAGHLMGAHLALDLRRNVHLAEKMQRELKLRVEAA